MLKNMKKLRQGKGISQQQLAVILGVSQQSIHKYENGRVEPDITMLCAMADFFHCSIDYLVGRSNQREQHVPQQYHLSYDEALLVDYFRSLSDAERTCVATLLQIQKDK